LVKIILLITILFSTINAQDFYDDDSVDFIQPYVALDYNVFNIDSEGIVGISAGWLIQDVSSVSISYFISSVDKNSTYQYNIKKFDIVYEYSFNNKGKHRGVIASAGISRNSIDKTNNGSKSIIFIAGIGYEYQINSKYIFSVRKDFDIYVLGGSDDVKTLYNTKFSIKYVFE
jgi:hypothetical protein